MTLQSIVASPATSTLVVLGSTAGPILPPGARAIPARRGLEVRPALRASVACGTSDVLQTETVRGQRGSARMRPGTAFRVPSVVPQQDKKEDGIGAALVSPMTKTKLIDGWRIKNGLDWTVAMVSFVLFVLLESAIIYSYVIFLKQLGY